MRQISVYGYRTIDVQAPFAPSDISGGVVWYDFSDISTLYTDSAKTTPVTSDGDAIGAAENKFNAGTYDATQTTTAAKPTYKTAIQNGRSVGRFDGGDGLQSAATVDLTSADEITAFVVFNRSSSVNELIYELSENMNNNDGFYLYGVTTDVLRSGTHHGASGTSGEYSVWDTTTTHTSTTVLHVTTADGSLTTNEVRMYVNGSENNTVLDGNDSEYNENSTANFGNEYLNIGARDNAASLHLTGDIMELIIYNSALSTADRQSVESYLNSKWVVY